MDYENVRFPENALFLVTGGAGFIGSNLCEAILRLGYRVRCMDNLSIGHRENVDLFYGNKGYTFIHGDIKNIDDCVKACNGVDYVLHHAAWKNIPLSIKDPRNSLENNILGSVNMLEAARRCGVKKFVYASSSSVYGDTDVFPNVEDCAKNPLSPYGAAKYANELCAKQYTLHYGLDTYGLRYFSVFGKRQDAVGENATVIPRFIYQLLHNERPKIHGDGSKSRDFVYIGNVIEANLKACLAPREAAGEAFNIGCGKETSLLEAYHAIAKLLNVDIEPEFIGERNGDEKHGQADISKAKKMLGYSPDYDFEKGLQETVEWYRTHI